MVRRGAYLRVPCDATNNVGDFLAGVFGPVAILWLVLGFLQQGIELRQNAKALELQAEELKNSVEQQRQLVAATRSQVEAERENALLERERYSHAALPRFVLSGFGSSSSGNVTTYTSYLTNLGASASRVRIVGAPALKWHSLTYMAAFATDKVDRFDLQFASNHPSAGDRLSISYIDALGRPGSVSFRYVLTDQGVLEDVVQA